MARITICTKISLLLVAVAVVASGLLTAHLYRPAIANARAVARQDAMTQIGRSVAMFVVTTQLGSTCLGWRRQAAETLSVSHVRGKRAIVWRRNRRRNNDRRGVR
jgi:hypothetical protein